MTTSQEILANLKDAGDRTELVDYLPRNYKVGRTKFIIVTGGVMSSVGKGVFSAALSQLLLIRGCSVAPIKFEGYLNVDSGTLNPFRHGEVFVLADGAETDLDLGNYERFMDVDLAGDNFVTAGKIYWNILNKERQGQFHGRDVLVIPHLTGEVKHVLRKLATKQDTDFVIAEIGGTIGDYENIYFVEAMRQLRYDEGRNNVIFVHLTPILYSEASDELKSKPTQHSVRTLQGLGIQPDIIVARSKYPFTKRIIEKISVYCNVPEQQVFKSPDVESIYQIPKLLDEQGLVETIMYLTQTPPKPAPKKLPFDNYGITKGTTKKVKIAVVGKYVQNIDAYLSLAESLEHAAVNANVGLQVEFIDSETVTENAKIIANLNPHAIVIPGGFGIRGVAGKIYAARYAREYKIPLLGLCLGFQIALIEIARNLCGLSDAHSTEFDPQTKNPIIYLLPEQEYIKLVGGTMRLGKHEVLLKNDTTAAKLYGKERINERFRHRYEFNQKYQKQLEKQGVVFSGSTPDGKIMQLFELKDHPFYLGTQFHPELISKPVSPHPLFAGLVKAAIERQT